MRYAEYLKIHTDKMQEPLYMRRWGREYLERMAGVQRHERYSQILSTYFSFVVRYQKRDSFDYPERATRYHRLYLNRIFISTLTMRFEDQVDSLGFVRKEWTGSFEEAVAV